MIGRARWLGMLALVAVAACSTPPPGVDGPEEILVLEVAPDRVPCVGEMAGRCLRVRGPDEDEWRTFYHTIEGFEHEPGVRYTLRVGRRDVPNPPADASSYAYRLLEIITREPERG